MLNWQLTYAVQWLVLQIKNNSFTVLLLLKSNWGILSQMVDVHLMNFIFFLMMEMINMFCC